jgi:hypothetical protein
MYARTIAIAVTLLALFTITARTIDAGPPPVARWTFAGPSTIAGSGTGEDWLYGVAQRPDGDYIVCGYTKVGSNPEISAVVARVGANKVMTSEQTFAGNPKGAVLFDITETPAEYVAVGGFNGNVLIARIDKSTVNTTWIVRSAAQLGLDPNAKIEAQSVRAVPASMPGGAGVVISGWQTTNSVVNGALFVRLDASFNVLAASIDTAPTYARSVRVTGSGFVLAGGANPPDTDIWVQGIDGVSNAPVWTRTYTKAQLSGFNAPPRPSPLCPGDPAVTNKEEADTVEVLPNGDLLLDIQVNRIAEWGGCGSVIQPSHIDLDTGLMRLTPTGLQLWSKFVYRFTGIDFRTPMRLVDDGVVLAGNDAVSQSTVNIVAVKTNLSATQQWQGTYLIGGDTNDCPFGMTVTNDGGIAIAGNNNLHGEDYFVTKIGPARDLWMMDDAADTGDEVYPITVMWDSPEIWVRNFEDFYPWPAGDPAHLHQNPEFRDPALQVPNYIYVEVRNRGAEPASGTLHVYWAKASTGLYWPQSWINAHCCGNQLCGDAIPETVTITNLQPGATEIVRVPWYPPDPALFTGGGSCGPPAEAGHFCLLARLETSSSPTMGMAFVEEQSTGQNTIANNNVVWKNVTVVDLQQGANKTQWTLVQNPTRRAMNVTLAFAVPREELASSILNGADVEITLSPNLMKQWIAGRRAAAGVTVRGNTIRMAATRAELRNLVLQPGQTESAGIRLIPRPGAVRFVGGKLDIIQLEGDKTVGGVRFAFQRTRVAGPGVPAVN